MVTTAIKAQQELTYLQVLKPSKSDKDKDSDRLMRIMSLNASLRAHSLIL